MESTNNQRSRTKINKKNNEVNENNKVLVPNDAIINGLSMYEEIKQRRESGTLNSSNLRKRPALNEFKPSKRRTKCRYLKDINQPTNNNLKDDDEEMDDEEEIETKKKVVDEKIDDDENEDEEEENNEDEEEEVIKQVYFLLTLYKKVEITK